MGRYNWINKPFTRLAQHILFWAAAFFIFLYLFKTEKTPQKIDYIYTGLFQLTLLPAVYLNLELLLPFISKRRIWWLYIAGLAVILVVFPFLNYRFFQSWSVTLLPEYFFISYFSFLEIAAFFGVYLFITSLLKLSKSWFAVNELRNQLLETEKEKMNMELLALKSQVNPHFLFNTLNSIYSLSLDKDDRMPDTVLQLSGILRYYLYESREDFVPLEKELRVLQDYIHLQRMRSDRKLDLKMEISGDAGDKSIAPLVLLTFMENAFKHGAKGKTGQAFIHLDIRILGNQFYFYLENNRGTVDRIEPEQFKGLGLENVRRRLELLYPGKHTLKVLEEENQFSVVLNLEL